MAKQLMTRSGDAVTLHGRKERNSVGNKVTFPLKGTIRFAGFPRKKKFKIFTEDGRASVLTDTHEHDIINLTKEDIKALKG